MNLVYHVIIEALVSGTLQEKPIDGSLHCYQCKVNVLHLFNSQPGELEEILLHSF